MSNVNTGNFEKESKRNNRDQNTVTEMQKAFNEVMSRLDTAE